MQYNQENLDKIKPLFPRNFIKQVAEKVSTKRKRQPYSTVYDALTVYRSGERKDANGNTHKLVRNQVGESKPIDKVKIFNKAVEMLTELGILNNEK